jgi:hypothetical protein
MTGSPVSEAGRRCRQGLILLTVEDTRIAEVRRYSEINTLNKDTVTLIPL